VNTQECQHTLVLARQGNAQALGDLLKTFRPYLKQQVAAVMRRRVQARFDDSDVVQEAMLDAVKGFGNFRGTTVAEFAAWLQQIVARAASHRLREHLGTAKRGVDHEQDAAGLAELVMGGTSPSVQVMRQEQAAVLAAALPTHPIPTPSRFRRGHQSAADHCSGNPNRADTSLLQPSCEMTTRTSHLDN
jgi:RNA polymerase sigma factor (sigma-70 family)